MSGDNILLSHENKISIITINRPERRNSFNEDVWKDFAETVAALRVKLPRAIVITGAGESFCAGFDVNPDNPQVGSLIESVQKKDPGPVSRLINYIRKVVDDFADLPVPIIAAINGAAFGGGAELAVRCDLRVADPGAVISFSEVRLGLMPDWGGGVALTRLVGPSVASDLVLTARRIDAKEACSLGLVNRISPQGKSLEEGKKLAETIARNGPMAVRSALEVIRRTSGMSLKDALDLEAKRAVELITSGECVHGVTGFLSRKDPEFPDI